MNTSDWWLVAFLCALAIVVLLAPRVLAAFVGDRERAGANLSGVFPGVPVVVAVLALIVGWGIFESGTPGPFGPLLPFAILLLYLPALRLGRRALALVALVLTPLSLATYFLFPAALNFFTLVVLALALTLLLLMHKRPVTEAARH